MQFIKKEENGEISIKMQGKFTFSDREEAKKIIDNAILMKAKKLLLDFEDIEFIDSAALGIFLLMNYNAKNHNIELVLVKPRNQVEKMFKISRFEEIFSISN